MWVVGLGCMYGCGLVYGCVCVFLDMGVCMGADEVHVSTHRGDYKGIHEGAHIGKHPGIYTIVHSRGMDATIYMHGCMYV